MKRHTGNIREYVLRWRMSANIFQGDSCKHRNDLMHWRYAKDVAEYGLNSHVQGEYGLSKSRVSMTDIVADANNSA